MDSLDYKVCAEGNALELWGFYSTDEDVGTPRVEVLHGPDEKAPKQPSAVALTKLAAQTGCWEFTAPLPAGRVYVELKVFLGSRELSRATTCYLGPPLNQETEVTERRDAPRLVLALNTTAQQAPRKGASAIGAAEVQAILDHVWKRLVGGLDQAWSGEDGWESVRRLKSGGAIATEEAWARAISEMLVCQPYAYPDNRYAILAAHLWRQVVDPVDPAYPIVAMCAQLATMGAITRGAPILGKYPNGLGASVDSIGIAQICGGSSISYTNGTPIAPALSDPKGFGPGDFFVWNGHAKGTGSKADHVPHIAFVLRIDRVGAGGWVQLFDTGACRAPGPTGLAARTGMVRREYGSGESDLSGVDGICDCEWGKSVSGPAGGQYPTPKCWGIGVLPKASPAELAGHVERMRRSRPLGFARLVLMDRGDKTNVFYATPLLRMYTASAEENFSIARCLWSLRSLPFSEKVQAYWTIYVPRDEAALRLMNKKKVGLQHVAWKTGPGRGITVKEALTQTRTVGNKPPTEVLACREDIDVYFIHDLTNDEAGGVYTEERPRSEMQLVKGKSVKVDLAPKDMRPDHLNLANLAFDKHHGTVLAGKSEEEIETFHAAYPYFVGDFLAAPPKPAGGESGGESST